MLVTVEHGSHQGATYPFTDEQLIIGRDPSCDVVLADEQVSTRHAAIARSRNGALSVLDLGSTNGTFVDGERIREQVLRGGEQITVGKSILRVYPASDGRTVLGSSSNGLGDRGFNSPTARVRRILQTASGTLRPNAHRLLRNRMPPNGLALLRLGGRGCCERLQRLPSLPSSPLLPCW